MSGTTDPARAQETALLGLLEQLWGDSEVGETVRKRAKALNPQIRIPDDNPVAVKALNALEQTQQKLSALETLIAERDKEAKQRADEADLRTRLGRAQDRFKLTDDGLTGTIKLMQERQIADPEAAAALYVDGLPKTKPTTASNFMPDKLNLYGTQQKDDAWEKLHTDPDQFFADVVNKVFTEMPIGA